MFHVLSAGQNKPMKVSDCALFFLIEDFTPVQYKLPPTPKPAKTLPPYNGFGSEEDSLSSCYGIQLRRPKKNLQTFLEKDRCDGSQFVIISHM